MSLTGDAAVWYAQHGLHVFPVHTIMDGGGCSCAKPDCQNPGKHPLTAHGLLDATKDLGQIQRWWARDPEANVAIRTGPESGLVVVDIDPAKGGLTTWSRVLEDRPEPVTRECETGGGGIHLYFTHPGWPVQSGVDVLGPGVDIRADGGYVVAPPSRHVAGTTYRWPDGKAEQLTQPMPDWLSALLRARLVRREKAPLDMAVALEGVPEGQRDVTLFRVASKMRWAGIPIEVAEPIILGMAEKCVPPFPTQKAKDKLASAYGRYVPTILEREGGDLVEQMDWDYVRVTTVTALGAVVFDFKELERSTKELTAEMTIRLTAPGPDAEPYTQRINILSMSARESARRELDSIFGKEALWAVVLHKAFSRCRQAFENVDRAVPVSQLASPSSVPFLVAGLLPAEGPSILFGSGSSAKTFTAMDIALTVAMGWDWIGRVVERRNVLFVDYETGEAMFGFRFARLLTAHDPSLSLDAVPVYYWDAKGIPLPEQIPAITQAAERHNCGFLVVDHAAAAAGSRPEEAEAALRMQRALGRIHIPALLIAHVTGEGERDPKQVLRPFGSIFWSNMARTTWYVHRAPGGDEDKAELGFYNRKANDDRRPSDFATNVFFEPDGGPVRFLPADMKMVSDLNELRGKEWGLWEQLLVPMTLSEMEQAGYGKAANLKHVVSRYPRLFERVSEGGGRGRETVWGRIE